MNNRLLGRTLFGDEKRVFGRQLTFSASDYDRFQARLAAKRQQLAPKRPQSIVQQFLYKLVRTIKAVLKH